MPILPGSQINIYDDSLAANKYFFQGAPNTNQDTLNYDPFLPGYAFIFWFKLPTWLTANFPNFANLTQKNFMAFSGLSDIDLQTVAHNYGFANNEYHVASTIQKQNTEFTLRHTEFSGSPIRNAYTFWVSGIRDPETGIATYPKFAGIDYAAKNHTAEMLYVVTRPDVNNTAKNNIEFACYYTAIMPKRIPLNHLNFELGSHDIQNLEIPFSGNLHISPQIDAFAKTTLDSAYHFHVEEEFDPASNSAGQLIGDSTTPALTRTTGVY